ncbi:MAG: hypothetical protein NZ957_05465 [Thaumarchaeota archaeon]|nr:hypothetical protein [Candidatus Calditenuaceae archaeon]MDW8041514.1 hypothetical protein [Nitrososphaerota archaeon]
MTGRELKLSLAGAAIAVAVLMTLSRVSGVSLSDVYELPAQTVALSVALSLLRMASQGLRFYLIVGSASRTRVGFCEALAMRGASEFFALTTVPFVADEAARAVMLARKGERPVTALWIATAELVVDVAVTAPLMVISGIYATLVGSWAIAVVVLVVSTLQIVGVSILAAYAGGTGDGGVRAGRLTALLPPQVRRAMGEGVREMRRVLRVLVDSESFSRTAAVIIASLAVTVMPSLVLLVLLGDLSAGGVVRALYSTMAGNALGVLPVSVGGAGVTEAGVYLYLTGVYGVGDWELVLRWRLLTYYVTLSLTAAVLAFYLLTLRRPNQARLLRTSPPGPDP